jgi:hypothetical protein
MKTSDPKYPNSLEKVDKKELGQYEDGVSVSKLAIHFDHSAETRSGGIFGNGQHVIGVRITCKVMFKLAAEVATNDRTVKPVRTEALPLTDEELARYVFLRYKSDGKN